MATDQPTDPTAARLREAVRLAAVRLYRERVAGDPDGVAGELDAALDTLIRYHRAVAARDALQAVPCYGNQWTPKSESKLDCIDLESATAIRCKRCTALAAAQERLAAYAKEIA